MLGGREGGVKGSRTLFKNAVYGALQFRERLKINIFKVLFW